MAREPGPMMRRIDPQVAPGRANACLPSSVHLCASSPVRPADNTPPWNGFSASKSWWGTIIKSCSTSALCGRAHLDSKGLSWTKRGTCTRLFATAARATGVRRPSSRLTPQPQTPEWRRCRRGGIGRRARLNISLMFKDLC